MTSVTEEHSKRISRITQRRDARLRDAVAARDGALRSLAACAKCYADFDAGVRAAEAKRDATGLKAEEARSAALQKNSDKLADSLSDAQAARRDADVAAFEKRRRAEADAEHEFILALAAAPSKPATDAHGAR